MTNVYKNGHLITKNERVKIPDCEYEETQVDSEMSEEFVDNAEKVEDTPDVENSEILEENIEVSEDADTDEAEISDNEEDEEETPQIEIPSKEELQAIYEQELKELATSVAQQAYYDALNKKKAELKNCIASVQTLMDDLVHQHRQFIEEYTNELKYMAIDIAEKMILEKINEDDLILEKLVLQTVNSVKNAEWLNVEISERLVGLVDVINKELEKPEYNGKAFVFPVAGTDTVCRVVTNEGAVVSSIEAQAENLRKEFHKFDKHN